MFWMSAPSIATSVARQRRREQEAGDMEYSNATERYRSDYRNSRNTPHPKDSVRQRRTYRSS